MKKTLSYLLAIFVALHIMLCTTFTVNNEALAIRADRARDFIGQKNIVIVLKNSGGKGKLGTVHDVIYIDGEAYVIFISGGVSVISVKEIIYIKKSKVNRGK